MTQTIHMKMVMDVYQYGRWGKCVYKLTYTYAWITQMEMQKEAGGKDIFKVMSRSIGTVT